MPIAGSFFNKDYTQTVHALRDEYRLISVGTDQFRAAAVALIDSFQNSIPRNNDVVLKQILEGFSHFFPKYLNYQFSASLSDRMLLLLNHHRKTELVDSMSYVLRQLAVDELYSFPLKYSRSFDDFNSETLKKSLRNPKTVLPASSLNALANALGISITLVYKEPGKELRKKEIFCGAEQGTSSKLNLLLQIQGSYYFSAVKHKTYFSNVDQLQVVSPKLIENTFEDKETLGNIFDLIKKNNKQLSLSYTHWHNTLLSMVDAEELTYEQLINLYIKFLPTQYTDTIPLTELEQSEKKPIPSDFSKFKKQSTIHLLISTLSSWICTDRVQADRFFEHIESEPVLNLK